MRLLTRMSAIESLDVSGVEDAELRAMVARWGTDRLAPNGIELAQAVDGEPDAWTCEGRRLAVAWAGYRGRFFVATGPLIRVERAYDGSEIIGAVRDRDMAMELIDALTRADALIPGADYLFRLHHPDGQIEPVQIDGETLAEVARSPLQ